MDTVTLCPRFQNQRVRRAAKLLVPVTDERERFAADETEDPELMGGRSS